jgi:aminomethyltransferase
MRRYDISSREHYRTKVFDSPFYPCQQEWNLNREWSRWRDYRSVPAYGDETLEYFAARNSCGLFDLTPMVKHRVSGPDAEAFMNRLVTRDVRKIPPGRVGYAAWCTDRGRVIDDGTIFHLRPGVYRLCSQEDPLDWLMINAEGFDVSLENETHSVCALALQGPTSCAVLRELGLEGIEALRPFDLAEFEFRDAPLTVSRTGYTGDLGYELWLGPEQAVPLWNTLFEAGELHGISPLGSKALDLLRIEAGYLLAGVDFLPALEAVRPENTRSPFELGLGWLVDFDKPLFNGRSALLDERQKGSRYALARLDVADNKPAEHADVMDRRGRVVGWTTSACWSPSAKKNIALATVRTPHGKAGEELQVEIHYQRELAWRRKRAVATVVDGPFWDPPRRRATPPSDR